MNNYPDFPLTNKKKSFLLYLYFGGGLTAKKSLALFLWRTLESDVIKKSIKQISGQDFFIILVNMVFVCNLLILYSLLKRFRND